MPNETTGEAMNKAVDAKAAERMLRTWEKMGDIRAELGALNEAAVWKTCAAQARELLQAVKP